jgi:hypothetical protein
MIRIAILAVILLLTDCKFQLDDEDEEPPPVRTAATAHDPRCHPGGVWRASLGACEYPDNKPPAAPR